MKKSKFIIVGGVLMSAVMCFSACGDKTENPSSASGEGTSLAEEVDTTVQEVALFETVSPKTKEELDSALNAIVDKLVEELNAKFTAVKSEITNYEQYTANYEKFTGLYDTAVAYSKQAALAFVNDVVAYVENVDAASDAEDLNSTLREEIVALKSISKRIKEEVAYKSFVDEVNKYFSDIVKSSELEDEQFAAELKKVNDEANEARGGIDGKSDGTQTAVYAINNILDKLAAKVLNKSAPISEDVADVKVIIENYKNAEFGGYES